MRIERVDVTAFGRLREESVELQPRLTVVLGANEAGKTTLLRAIRAALYGIDAGGQGRALGRSDWSRWRPWEHQDRYGLAMTYTLGDGRRFRVARRLELHREEAQVVEIGGRDVTDVMRIGRLVVPGWHHLGIDEAVFCATACLGEESLRTDSPDTAMARADRLQEAIERLADSASRATAAEALARLRHAMERVGTENRSRSPLGAATSRLRSVEKLLAQARERVASVGGEQDRLRRLDEAAAEANRRRVAAERAWLEARLAEMGARRDELEAALAEQVRLEARCLEWAGFASFPLDREERVVGAGEGLRLATNAEAEALARWEQGRERLRLVERRRSEIATSLHALGTAPRVGEEDRALHVRLAAEVASEGAVERQAAEMRTAESRLAALRREVASTGLGPIPVGSCDAVGELLDEALAGAGGRGMRSLAGGVAVLGAAAALACVLAGLRGAVAAVVLSVALLTAGVMLLTERLTEGPGQAARRRLGRLCPGLDVSDSGLRRCADRLPDLSRLHDDLRRQELLVETHRAQLGASSDRIAELARRCLVLAARLPVEVDLAPASGLVGAAAELVRARQALAAVGLAADAGRRRVELEEEDSALAREAAVLRSLREAADEATTRRVDLAAELASHLEAAGIAEPASDPIRAVAAFRRAAATRRQLEDARARLVEVRRRVSALGPADGATFAAQAEQLGEELRRRGGDPELLAVELPLEPGRLHALEVAAERARQEASAAGAQAADLRARIAGVLDGLPPLADLEDERSACLAVRERALGQLEALRLAASTIEEAARRVHRNVAPRLAASVGSRLALLTEGRYSEVNVDAERFAVHLRAPERPDLVPLDVLSHGTRDQVSLLLRLALAEALSDAGEPVPILLDDPLLSADPMRRENAIGFLLNLAEAGHQVVVTTADPSIAEHVTSAAAPGCGVVTLGARRTSRPAPMARARAV